jgi:hypothetical protein
MLSTEEFMKIMPTKLVFLNRFGSSSTATGGFEIVVFQGLTILS